MQLGGGGMRAGTPFGLLELDRRRLRLPGAHVTLTVFRPCSGWMKVTVCEPAETLMPTLGVLPSGLPSRMTFETGMELMLSVPVPDALRLSVLSGGGLGAGAGPGPGLAATGGGALPISKSSILIVFSACPSSKVEVLREVVEALLGRDEAPVLARVDVEPHRRVLEHGVGQLLLDLLVPAADERDVHALGHDVERDLALEDLELEVAEVVRLAGGDVDRLLRLLVAVAAVEADLVLAGGEVLELERERALVGAVDEDLARPSRASVPAILSAGGARGGRLRGDGRGAGARRRSARSGR